MRKEQPPPKSYKAKAINNSEEEKEEKHILDTLEYDFNLNPFRYNKIISESPFQYGKFVRA